MEYWGDEPWLQLNNVYSYGPVYASTLEQYTRSEGRPALSDRKRLRE